LLWGESAPTTTRPFSLDQPGGIEPAVSKSPPGIGIASLSAGTGKGRSLMQRSPFLSPTADELAEAGPDADAGFAPVPFCARSSGAIASSRPMAMHIPIKLSFCFTFQEDTLKAISFEEVTQKQKLRLASALAKPFNP